VLVDQMKEYSIKNDNLNKEITYKKVRIEELEHLQNEWNSQRDKLKNQISKLEYELELANSGKVSATTHDYVKNEKLSLQQQLDEALERVRIQKNKISEQDG